MFSLVTLREMNYTALLNDKRFLVALGVTSSYCLLPWISRKMIGFVLGFSMRKKAAELRKARDESIEWARKTAASLDAKERDRISSMSDRQLIEALQSCSVTAVNALKTYLALAIQAHEKTNCVTLFIKESLAIAEEWDKKAREDGFVKPPFFGLPMSVKESTPMKDHVSTWGCASCPFPAGNRDALVVQSGRVNGAVPFVRTNVPLLCLTYDSINGIYGASMNPYSRERSSGGSSGGESSLVGAKGSPIGMGSDLGGSIRVPAAYAGVAGFRPTGQRVSSIGYPLQAPGKPFIMPADGPIAQSMETCAEFMKLYWQNDDLFAADRTVPPLSWNGDLFEEGTKYKIGYWMQDSWLQAVPSQVRAIEKAKAALEAEGHTLVPFTIPESPAKIVPYFYAQIFMDGGHHAQFIFDIEMTPREFSSYKTIISYPVWFKKIRGYFYNLLGWKRNAIEQFAFPLNSAAVQQCCYDVLNYRMLMNETMRKAGVDALMCPPTYTPALKSGTVLGLPLYSFFTTAHFNILDFAAGVVKVTSFSEADEKAMKSYIPTCPEEKVFKKECEKGARGLPVAVQIAAPSFRDEVALRILCDLEKALVQKND